MKNLIFLLFIALSGLMIMSCEGPEGPAGANGVDGIDGVDGANGVDGVDGTDGTDGVAGTAVCLNCHTLTHKNAVTDEYHQTRHFNATAVGYAGGRKSCARCHSHEGFVETQFTGMDTTAFDIQIPTVIGCTTCHDTHNTFDFENDGQDYAIRTNKAVDLIITDDFDLDFGDNSNLCATCHQPRRPAPVDDGNGMFNITSSHYGPHHAPNGTFLFGYGGYEVEGLDVYPEDGTSAHFQVGCIGCHMVEGGHSLETAGCTTCHTNGAPDIQAEIEGLLGTLADLLVANGVLDDEGHVVKGEFPVDVAGAFYNYALVEEDLSFGIHNPKYAKALLKNSIAALQ